MRPGKLRLVVLMQTSLRCRRPKVSRRSAQTGGAAGGADVAAGIQEHVLDAFFVGAFLTPRRFRPLHVGVDFGAAGDDEGRDFHAAGP